MSTERASACLLLAALLCGCGAEPPTLTLEVIPGHETDAFQVDPPVTTWDVQVTGADGAVLATASAAPAGAFDFGEIPANQPLTLQVTGRDAGGAPIVRGRSLGGIYLAAVSGEVIPIFAQRLGQWARPPGELPATRVGAPAAPLAGRYLLLTGGEADPDEDPAGLLGYDLFTWQGSTGLPLPRPAGSLISRGAALLVIDAAGASWIDYATGSHGEVARPAGLASFAEITGGRTVVAPEGRAFVVGATRAGAPTDAVLVLDTDGTLRAARLSAPRSEAAAAWIEGVGLLVAGGSATASGVELLAPDAATAAPRAFPPDPTRGAAAVPDGFGDVVLVGGVLPDGAPSPTRQIDPACPTDCAATALDAAALPAPLTGVTAFALPGARILAVGEDTAPAALTRTFVIAPDAVTELPLREPRAGATVTPTPTGAFALLGGRRPDGAPALTVEMLLLE